MSSRVLVTGSAGFVGQHVVAALEGAGAEVVAVPHRWRDAHDLGHQVGGGDIPACIHLGWYAAPADYLVAADANLRSLRDSIDLVELLGGRGCRHLLVAGTQAEYAPQARPLQESDPVRPWSVYGATKAALSTLLNSSWRPDGMVVAWARLFNLTGPGEASARFLPTVARSLLRRDAIDLSPGDQVRDFLDVRDVAAALVVLSSTAAAGTFNVCSGEGIQLRELLTRLAVLLDGSDLLHFGARGYGEHDAAYAVGDSTRLRTTTGWAPRFGIDAMLSDVAAYWRAAEASMP